MLVFFLCSYLSFVYFEKIAVDRRMINENGEDNRMFFMIYGYVPVKEKDVILQVIISSAVVK